MTSTPGASNSQQEVFDNIPPGLVKVGAWVNQEKRRYYHLFLGRDLFGALVVKREWGSLDTKRQGGTTHVFQDWKQAKLQTLIKQIHKRRLLHGYESKPMV